LTVTKPPPGNPPRRDIRTDICVNQAGSERLWRNCRNMFRQNPSIGGLDRAVCHVFTGLHPQRA
jgi:hypothetical protein